METLGNIVQDVVASIHRKSHNFDGMMRYIVAVRNMNKGVRRRNGEKQDPNHLSIADVALLMCLACHVHDITGICWPSQDTLSLELGCSLATVRASLKHLISCKLVSSRIVQRYERGPCHNEYTLNLSVIESRCFK